MPGVKLVPGRWFMASWVAGALAVFAGAGCGNSGGGGSGAAGTSGAAGAGGASDGGSDADGA